MTDTSIKTIPYTHKIGSHCESGSMRNVLNHAGIDISEPMVFGLGSGVSFYYLFFVKGPSGFPMVALRTPPGAIVKNIARNLGYRFYRKSFRSQDEGLSAIDRLLADNRPVALSVDMFYMKYLPSFLHIHAPFHFIVAVGRNKDSFAVSDPYHATIGELHVDDLKAAWQTGAPMTKDNFLFYLDEQNPKPHPDLRKVARAAILKTCRNMVPPPIINKLLFFAGIEGMRTFANKIPTWPDTYEGVRLREGILFNAVTFEDQGTGGGAFRLMYGAFLQEVAALFDFTALRKAADELITHGHRWKDVSRQFIRVGKLVPMDNNAYAAWKKDNEPKLREGLAGLRDEFLKLADFEYGFFKELRRIVSSLG
jgi:hypothetical protein